MFYVESTRARDLFEARQSARYWQSEEEKRHNHNLRPWGYYNEGVESYNKHFERVLPEGGFVHFVSEQPKPLSAVDAFGPSSFIRDLSVKTDRRIFCGVALALSDLRDDSEHKTDSQLNIIQVASADIYTSSQWLPQTQGHLLTNTKNPKADLIVCRPVYGWELIDKNGKSHLPNSTHMWLVTQRLWKLLAENGTMFIKYLTTNADLIDNWIDNSLKRVSINGVHWGDGAVKLVKNAESNKNIPGF